MISRIFSIAICVTIMPTARPPAASSCPAIRERPIPFDSVRQRLTLEYIRQHYDPQATTITIVPQMVVVHWTQIGTLDSTYTAFAPTDLPASRSDIESGGALNVSSHYLVDRDGTIYRLLPDSLMARHVIGLNRIALGIENVGSARQPLTHAQLNANVALIRCLERAHPTIHYVIGHFEYGEFRHTPVWQERDSTYFTKKDDPGPTFMEQLRHALHIRRTAARISP